MYLEIGLIIFGSALLLLVVFCIPILLKLWRAASDIAISLQALNERLPEILKNMEQISANINQSTTAINEQVQKYSLTAQRFNRLMTGFVGGIEFLSPLAMKAPVFRKLTDTVALIKGGAGVLECFDGEKERLIMVRMTFSNKWGRVAVAQKPQTAETKKSAEDVVREMKNAAKVPGDEDYREKSLRIHGLVCARCGRDFSGANRHMLTVHHKDGNHHNNPQDGSNWENLCAYCHEDVHSREVLAQYLEDPKSGRDASLVYGGQTPEPAGSSGLLAQKLMQALQKKK